MTVKHPTASTFVFHRFAAGWRLALVEHPIYRRSMIPGGHVEDNETAEHAALREIEEETGVDVSLVAPPSVPIPPDVPRVAVAVPWWILEQPAESDNHVSGPHIHIDHLFVAVADSSEPNHRPGHLFSWYRAGDLSRLSMFDDTRMLAELLFSRIDETIARPKATDRG